jgi:hypothetical protein
LLRAKLRLSAAADKSLFCASIRKSALYFFLEKKVAIRRGGQEPQNALLKANARHHQGLAGMCFSFLPALIPTLGKTKTRCLFPLSTRP